MREPLERALPIPELRSAKGDYYKLGKIRNLPNPGSRYCGASLISKNGTLTDAVILTSVSATSAEYGQPIAIHSNYKYFHQLLKHHPWARKVANGSGVSIHRALDIWDTGAGHVIERIHRLLCLPIPCEPIGRLTATSLPVSGRALVHLKITKWCHGCQKSVLEKTQAVMSKWMAERSDIEFVDVNPAWDFDELISQASASAFYIGIPSGVMHLSTALRRTCLVIVGDIHQNDFFLPIRRNVCPPKLAWYYPHNTHLHEHGGGKGISALSAGNLNLAIGCQLNL